MNEAMLNLVKEICGNESWLAGRGKDTRKRVITSGKLLIKLQQEQKKTRLAAEAEGEEGQTWKDFCEETKVSQGNFPAFLQAARYILIAKYPGAYGPDMSIKEAYKEAGKWKANAGSEPLPSKLNIKRDEIGQVGKVAGQLETKMEKLLDLKGYETLQAFADDNEWTYDAVQGAVDQLTITRQCINALLRQLTEIEVAEDASA